MTREDAIKYWEGLRKTFSIQLEKEENHFGRMHLQTTIDAIDMAISALQQQEHFRDLTKKVEPLTLDELRKMDGEPVWIKLFDPDEAFWVLRNGWVDTRNPEPMILFHMRWYSHVDYGKTWLAYRQKPEEDDNDRKSQNNL